MTTFLLKIIAVVLMTVDHVGKFFGLPVFMRWLGRLATPVFFFCAVEGDLHTSDRKKYIKRLYLMSLLMCGLNILVPFALEGYGVIVNDVEQNIFSSILQGVIVIHILEETKNNPQKDKRLTIKNYCLYQLVVTAVLLIGETVFDFDVTIVGTVLCALITTEGSILLTGVMLLYYFCRGNKKKLAVSYTVYCILFGAITVLQIPQRAVSFVTYRINETLGEIVSIPFQLLGLETVFRAPTLIDSIFKMNYQWMMIFALPLVLLYNGKKGKGFKNFFYVYYPLQIHLLCIVSSIL